MFGYWLKTELRIKSVKHDESFIKMVKLIKYGYGEDCLGEDGLFSVV